MSLLRPALLQARRAALVRPALSAVPRRGNDNPNTGVSTYYNPVGGLPFLDPPNFPDTVSKGSGATGPTPDQPIGPGHQDNLTGFARVLNIEDRMIGHYPDLPFRSSQTRSYTGYWDEQTRRNYGETLHEQDEVLSVWFVDEDESITFMGAVTRLSLMFLVLAGVYQLAKKVDPADSVVHVAKRTFPEGLIDPSIMAFASVPGVAAAAEDIEE